MATGASARWLGVPGEARLRGRGVSTCATCDGAFFRDKRIVVVGGGDSAMEEAIFLTRFGSQVTVLHRRGDVARQQDHGRSRARITPRSRSASTPPSTKYAATERLETLIVRDTVTNETSYLAADALFVAIGHDPNTAIFAGQLELDAYGYVVSADGVHTNVPGVFVAGDVYDVRYKQAITAAGMGCRAALEAERYLEELSTRPPDDSGIRRSALPLKKSARRQRLLAGEMQSFDERDGARVARIDERIDDDVRQIASTNTRARRGTLPMRNLGPTPPFRKRIPALLAGRHASMLHSTVPKNRSRVSRWRDGPIPPSFVRGCGSGTHPAVTRFQFRYGARPFQRNKRVDGRIVERREQRGCVLGAQRRKR